MYQQSRQDPAELLKCQCFSAMMIEQNSGQKIALSFLFEACLKCPVDGTVPFLLVCFYSKNPEAVESMKDFQRTGGWCKPAAFAIELVRLAACRPALRARRAPAEKSGEARWYRADSASLQCRDAFLFYVLPSRSSLFEYFQVFTTQILPRKSGLQPETSIQNERKDFLMLENLHAGAWRIHERSYYVRPSFHREEVAEGMG